MPYEAVVIGASAGGLEALKSILPGLPPAFVLPVAIVQHIGERAGDFMVEYLNRISSVIVKEAEDKEPLSAGHVYLAPAGYHLLIEYDRSFSLSVDSRVNYSCPSIDVLFESAADVFEASVIGVVLTGGNADGANGLKNIKARGGVAIVQTPETALASTMPKAALAATPVDHVVDVDQIAPLLTQLSKAKEETYGASS